jgi:hypothetical protein
MAGHTDDDSNPFLNRRKQLEQDAEDEMKKLALTEEKERLWLQEELQEHLDQAKKILLEDIDDALSEIPPVLINKAGSTSFESEAFAWFYKEKKTHPRGEDEEFLFPVSSEGPDAHGLRLTPQIIAEPKLKRFNQTLRLDPRMWRYLRNEDHLGELSAIYSHMRQLLAEANFGLETIDGFKFTISWLK